MSDTTTRPFAMGDPSSIKKYCELMHNFDEASYDSPLREGSTFSLALVRPTPFDRKTQWLSSRRLQRTCKYQGCTVPYFYGAHKVTAPWGETVSVLAMEYVTGPRLWEVRTALDSNAPLITAFTRYQNYERYFSLFQSAIETITYAHAHDTRHCDIRDAHFLVDVAHDQV
ncbi:hypothetical protein BD626DRAFT_569189 [Schizophyllum amplum]|uniref:Protein kinase domain-containing protein n=1 Tax=Schizophyllum amplum TaxID=97359 RepID=A0A550CEB7_9AGAR|nr:hypothetical protein BD626DRAFT_569189 [Auriculariopsis ampla]